MKSETAIENDSEKAIKVIIVDDEERAQELLERQLYRIPDIKICGKASCIEEALEMVMDKKPDLVFLDIQMPEKNGFQLVDYLKKYLIHTTVIFVTAHAEFAIEAIKASAFDYLLKPVVLDQLRETILRYKAEKHFVSQEKKVEILFEKVNRPSKLKFNTRTGYILVSPEEILFCEADVNYTILAFGKENKEIVTINLGKVEELLSPYSFFRISRSILINTTFLKKVDRQKKKCLLEKSDFKIYLEIPPNHIRELEKLIDDSHATFKK